MSMRQSSGTQADWLDTRIEAGFSNFLHIDRKYSAHPVIGVEGGQDRVPAFCNSGAKTVSFLD